MGHVITSGPHLLALHSDMKTGKRPGQTLVEVAVATIVAAMTTTAVFSVILSGFASQAKGDKRGAAAVALKRAQETLKSYVSATPTNGAFEPTGPGGVGVWALDNTGGWALKDGLHTITPMLDGTALQGGSLTYTVSSVDCGFGLGTAPNNEKACKTIAFTLIYPDN